MRLGSRTSPPRHLAGRRQPDRAADFDVEAALSDPEFDFDALFDPDADVDDGAPRIRAARHRIAFAVSVTLAALPLLVLDNFPARAGTGDGQAVTADATSEDTIEELADTIGQLRGTIELDTDAIQTPVTAAAATVFVEESTTTTVAPEPSTTVAPTTTAAPSTTTTARPTTTTAAPPPPAPTTTVAAARASASPDPNDPATWDRLAKCESGGNWAANTGNGYYGGLQFSHSTWQYVGGTGYPHEHSRETQIEMGKRLHARSGWSAWPGCSRKLGWA